MELAQRFQNTISVVQHLPETDRNDLIKEWAYHILFHDKANFAWINDEPALSTHPSAQKLTKFGPDSTLIVFKDGSVMIISGSGAMRFSASDMEDPTALAVLCVSSPKLNIAITQMMESQTRR